MVGHDHRPPVAHFWIPTPVAAGETVTLDRDAAHHVHVLRLVEGNRVGLTDGRGKRA